MELVWWAPVGVPAFLMITALALQEFEHALLGPHDQSDASRPQSVTPGIDTPTQQGASPFTGAFPAPAAAETVADSGLIMIDTEPG